MPEDDISAESEERANTAYNKLKGFAEHAKKCGGADYTGLFDDPQFKRLALQYLAGEFAVTYLDGRGTGITIGLEEGRALRGKSKIHPI